MPLAQELKPLEIDAYVDAVSLDAAVRALADGAGTPVAGGTDLWIQKDLGKRAYGRRLVNIRRVAALGGIAEEGGRIRIGALATMTEILESPLLLRAAPVLPATAGRFASVQIRNAATVGGNIANASPAADMVLPLLCLDSEVELARWHEDRIDRRRLPLAAFFAGPGKTRAMPGELITAVSFDRPAAGSFGAFQKSGPRPALEIARVALCIAGRREGRRLTSVRIAAGAVAPTPIRCPRTEAEIEGVALDDAAIARALESLGREIAPIDDVRGSAWYRRHLAAAFLEEELGRVARS
ncbi:MAG: xanthine dehydrogenase family protein subunit M [Alphaproteobacteria bacterium]